MSSTSINTHAPQHINTSTHQHQSTRQQHLNTVINTAATHQHQHINTAIINTSKHQHRQHINTSAQATKTKP
jgi:hypothetical protein